MPGKVVSIIFISLCVQSKRENETKNFPLESSKKRKFKVLIALYVEHKKKVGGVYRGSFGYAETFAEVCITLLMCCVSIIKKCICLS